MTSYQIDPLLLADAIRQRLADFAVDDHFVNDESLTGSLRRVWEGPASAGGLLSETWVEGAFPSKPTDSTLIDLIGEGFSGELAAHLHSNGAFPNTRRLFTHQFDALTKGLADPPPALIITSGTGSGKTECFLLPMLNRLYKGKKQRGQGIRALILYPMNALVNDQVDRLDRWLNGQDRASFFYFTSETPERILDLVPRLTPSERQRRSRYWSRDHARGLEDRQGQPKYRVDQASGALLLNPRFSEEDGPDVLITNYSMLEYMLCRPQDSVFFGSNLECVVLDEAHLYNGTLAAEISLLLRRLYDRCGVPPDDLLQLATSATIGSGDPQELVEFASAIFSRSQGVSVIQGEPVRQQLDGEFEGHRVAEEIATRTWLQGPTITVDENGDPELADGRSWIPQLLENLRLLAPAESFNRLAAAQETRPARILHECLRSSRLVLGLQNILWNDGQKASFTLSSIAERLFGGDNPLCRKATTYLLQLGSAARLEADEQPLVPNRIHLLTRSTEGISLCLNPACTGPKNLRWRGLGSIQPSYTETCQHPGCGSATISLVRCTFCGEPHFLYVAKPTQSGFKAGFYPGDQIPNDARAFLASTTPTTVAGRAFVRIQTGELATTAAADAIEVFTQTFGNNQPICPRCGKQKFKTFHSGVTLMLGIVAETVLAHSPVFGTGDFSRLPAKGRRLLSFSDSRSEAARLGPRLRNQHETHLTRVAILRAMANAVSGAVATKEAMVAAFTQALKANPGDAILTENLKNAERDLAAARMGPTVKECLTTIISDAISYQFAADIEATPDASSQSLQTLWDENHDACRDKIETLCLQEISRPFGTKDLEARGLLEVIYAGTEELAVPAEFRQDTERTAPFISDWLSVNWPAILRLVLDAVRRMGISTTGDTYKDRTLEYLGSFGMHSVASNVPQRKSIFGSGTKTISILTEVLKSASDSQLSDGQAKAIAMQLGQVAFDQIIQERQRLPWIEATDEDTAPAIRLRLHDLRLRRPVNLQLGAVSSQLYSYSVAGLDPSEAVESTVPTTHEWADASGRYGMLRKEYQAAVRDPDHVLSIGLWAEEHSAQLDPKENRLLQNLFKCGFRNLLSSTTTMELGIDIGGLASVLMSNVPPGKANYLQRAGRAGRRADGTSIAVGFCREQPYDKSVFLRFDEYLGRPLRGPRVLLGRDAIVRRQFHAFILSEFFRAINPGGVKTGAMSAFRSMGAFCGEPTLPYWSSTDNNVPIEAAAGAPFVPGQQVPEWVSDQSEPLRTQLFRFLDHIRGGGEPTLPKRLKNLSRGTALEGISEDVEGFLKRFEEELRTTVEAWATNYVELKRAWSEACRIPNLQIPDRRPRANAIYYQARQYYEISVIEGLAQGQVIPSYGFPIDLLQLKVQPRRKR